MRITVFILTLLFCLSSVNVTGAAICSRGNVPAATLLVPYFEVDTAAPGGRTTLFSINNTSDEPTLAYVTIWSDWGIPLLGFFVHLGPDGTETINLRDVINSRQVPSLDGADPEIFPGCFDGASTVIGASAEFLQTALTGQPNPESLNCHASDRGETSLAVGFVTVDLADDCVELQNAGEWVRQGLAADQNLLWGDVFYVDTDENSARGRNAVSVLHDPSLDVFDLQFYPNNAQRRMVDEAWRTRYISGAEVEASTEIIVWIGQWNGIGSQNGLRCDSSGLVAGLSYVTRSGPENGPLMDPPSETLFNWAGAVTRRLNMEELLQEERLGSGVLQIEAWLDTRGGVILPEPPYRLQSIVWPIFRADGRFSLALEATPVDGSCEP